MAHSMPSVDAVNIMVADITPTMWSLPSRNLFWEDANFTNSL